MISIYFLIWMLKAVYSEQLIRLNSELPYWIEEFSILDFIIDDGVIQRWTSWFQYLPLSSIVYSDQLGVLDSNCYHLFSSVEKESNQLNLLHYDCQDLTSRTITKVIQFIGNDDLQYSYEIDISIFEYENYWYYFDFIFFPYTNQFQIIIIKNEEVIMDEFLQIVPFSNVILIQKIGGSFIVENSRLINIEKGRKFASFPGRILPVSCNNKLKDFAAYAIQFISRSKLCRCQENPQNNLDDYDFLELNTQIYISKYNNCNSFLFSGWFKIKDIIQSDVTMTYQFIKLSSNYQNGQLQNQNLSPFQLFYKFEENSKKLIITTYSYQFPSVNLDFTNNPFLITREVDINHNIQLWHLIYVKLEEDDFQVNIKFFDMRKIYEYNMQMNIKQFHQIYYKLILGNNQQSNFNFLNIMGRNLYLIAIIVVVNVMVQRRRIVQLAPKVHQEFIFKIINNVFVPISQLMILIARTIRIFTCSQSLLRKKIQNANMGNLNQMGNVMTVQNQDAVTCLECVLNPKGWSKNPECKSSLQFQQDGSTSAFVEEENDGWTQYFNFNGINLEFCVGCVNSSIIDLNNINYDNNAKFQPFMQFCWSTLFQNDCYFCQTSNCSLCALSITGQICIVCDWYSERINGQCIALEMGILDEKNCRTPYYITSNYDCVLCSITNCVYCFEYVFDDLTKSTLYQNFQKFNGEDNLKVGCALCEDGYIFDFQLGECLKKSSKIDTCLRSYINQEGTEICTLSSKQDFSVAKEIINCEQLISNCLQCFITVQSILRCIICKVGYTSTTTEMNGRCSPNKRFNAKISIEGDFYIYDAWMQRIQSFMGSFLPNQYFYPKSNSYFVDEVAISCLEGSEMYQNKTCLTACQPDCIECKLRTDTPKYYCKKCPIDQYKRPQRVQRDGQCLNCPPLCLYCQERTAEEISLIQPNFIVNENNQLYTKQCIQPIFDPNVKLSTKQYIPIYCLDEQCSSNLVYDYKGPCYLYDNSMTDLLINQNINYLNVIGAQSIIIQLQFTPPNAQCNQVIRINSNQLKEQIFSLRTTNLTILGNGIRYQPKDEEVKINNFEIINIFSIDIQLSNLTFNLLGDQKLKFTMKNVKILGINQNQVNKLFNSQQFESIDLVNITIMNIVLNESSFFKIEFQLLEAQVQINQLTIINSTFINTDLFLITNSQISIKVDSLLIENCTLINSTILKMKQNQIVAKLTTISHIRIRNCQLSYSSIINYDDLTQLQIFNLQILQNTWQNSNFMIFFYNLSLTDANFEDNILNNSILINAIDTNATSDVTFFLEQLSVINLKLMNSNLIYLSSSSQVKMIIQFSNFILQKVEGIDTFNNVQNLFKFIHCFSCSIKYIQILNTKNIPIFYFFESNEIIIESLIFQQNTQKNQIHYCQQSDEFNNQLLFVQGFSFIKLNQLKIINYENFNQAFIEILSSPQQLENVSQNIEITNSLFQNNIIKKVLQKSIISIISIYSKKQQFVNFEDLNFQQNFFHQYLDDPTENFAGLIYIDSTQGQINISNLYCKENAITNSSTSFLVLISQSIFFNNATVSYHNVISQELWNKFYQFDLGQQYDQDQINQIIQQLYPTYVQGGVAKINCEQFVSQNSKYLHILALTSAVFDIKTLGQGQLQFINNTIQSISSIYRYGTDNFGCININSLNSYLNLEVSNTNFLNVQNGLSTVLFTISPSQRKASILLKDIQMINCLSFLNQLIKVQFPQYKEQSLFKISILNIKLIFEESAWIRYFSQFGASTEITQMNQDNGIFNIVGGQITVEQFVLKGIILSHIFKIENSIQLLIKNMQIIDVFSFYQLPLIFVDQQVNSIIILEQLIIQRFSIYQFRSGEEEFFYITPQYVVVECQLQYLSQQDEQHQQNLISQNIQQLQEESNNIGYPLLYFISSNNKARFIVNSVQLIQNKCLSCSKGGLFFDLTQFNYVKIKEFLCIYNQIKENGCLNFKLNSSQNNQNKVMIYNSNFIQNNASQGGAINAENIALFIRNCKIVGNRVTQAGGGIYADIDKKDFEINKSIVILNKAKVGGGIYFAKQYNLNDENFFQSVLLFNYADVYGNNLVETPTHLSLSINDIDIMSEQQKFGRNTMLTSNIRPYNVIEQGQLLKVKQLMIPSNQKINSYQIYVPSYQIFINYIHNILISVKNRFNEKLENQINSSCQVNAAIFYENNHSVSQEKVTYNVELDQNQKAFDLSSLSFRFDPYNQDQSLLQIEFKCLFDQNSEQLEYLIYAKALKCQLGEFYVDKGCQICQSNQGFYSVTYNTTKCSIFDKQKFDNISSNQIKLQPGYWRPNYLSDYTESCFKNPKFCIGGWDVGNELCSLGHIGGLCEECDNFDLMGKGQFYKNLSDFQCQECNEIWKSIVPFVLTSIWAFLQILITLRSIEKSNKLFSSLKVGQKYSKIIFKLNQDHESILIKMLLNYLWIFTVVFNISVSFSFNFIEQTSNTLFVMVNNLDCYLTEIQNIELIYLRLIFMLMLIIIQLLIIWAGFAIHAKCKKQLLNRSYISNTLLYLYVSNYAALIKQFCSIISTRQISQIAYIQGDVSLLYGTSNHISWIIFFAIPGLGILGLFIPFSLFFIMYINREQLDNIKLRRHICYLFNEYNSESYFWESIKLTKKTIIIIILTYFEGNIFLKASLLGLCLLVYQLAAVKQKPYIISSLNYLDIQTGQICSITLFLAGANYVCEQENYTSILIPLQICIILLCVKLCYPFLINIFRVYFKKYKVPFVQLLYKISRYINANCSLTNYLNNQLKIINQREYRLRNNFIKIRCHLISLSKAQLGYQKQIFSLINSQSTIRYRQTLVDIDVNKLITS
ncbi:unnamed protein product (macronuclear) [Paramecium tetraurelia]|uniref:Transmembrane protein n=1 Tax=Paramecium tetraurelia TaxID=5888 RepID=A0BDR2_PARTE|nr:uncharacterized protein GSPATT00027709001 [Paramecium tetraurelia]CAK56679.1 unnamed protein product [Paramecium tetraurelia]|eukprot:XP_001424077.1 hypothetical protein (macronuclear) [Paramecium tetraurelia strain d4-2]